MVALALSSRLIAHHSLSCLQGKGEGREEGVLQPTQSVAGHSASQACLRKGSDTNIAMYQCMPMHACVAHAGETLN
jgi:hypothetical protein